MAKALLFFAFFWLALYAASAQNPQKSTLNYVDDVEILGSWKLYKKTAPTGRQIKRYEDADFYVSFSKTGSFDYNLDVNNCGTDYQIKQKGLISFGAGASCTEACCDQEVLDYQKCTNYEIKGNQLILKSKEEMYYFFKNN